MRACVFIFIMTLACMAMKCVFGIINLLRNNCRQKENELISHNIKQFIRSEVLYFS